VAAALGLHRKTVYGWLAKFRDGGRDALVAKPVPGRPPKLSGAQIARVPKRCRSRSGEGGVVRRVWRKTYPTRTANRCPRTAATKG
jgi:transposase